MPDLGDLLSQALATRATLIARLTGEDTDCYRVFHGSQEGLPGLAVDKYGDLVLAQTFHRSLGHIDKEALERFVAEHFADCDLVVNDRSSPGSAVRNRDTSKEPDIDLGDPGAEPADDVFVRERTVRERGTRLFLRARHRGNDPWLFLDLRSTRRAIAEEADGKAMLNLFAYTCGAGVMAGVFGARRVLNVDFSRSALKVGDRNAAANSVDDRVESVQSDVFPAMRQLGGGRQPRVSRGRRLPEFPPLQPEKIRRGASGSAPSGQEPLRGRRPGARLPDGFSLRRSPHLHPAGHSTAPTTSRTCRKAPGMPYSNVPPRSAVARSRGSTSSGRMTIFRATTAVPR